MRMVIVKMMSIFLKFFLGKVYKTTVVNVGRIKLSTGTAKDWELKAEEMFMEQDTSELTPADHIRFIYGEMVEESPRKGK